jgi:pyruvate carboxylase
VTPSSKVVGDLALHLVAVGADPDDFAADPRHYDIPDSVVGFLSGELGDPPGGWPEPFRTKALAGRAAKPAHTDLTEEERQGLVERRRETLNSLLFPVPTAQFVAARQRYSDVSVLPTSDYLYGLRAGDEHQIDLDEGKRLLVGLQSISDPDARGFRTVMCTLNGQLRPINVRDESVTSNVAVQEKADLAKPGHVAAPFDGTVTVSVESGATVSAGETVATIEAMKMEAAIAAPMDGTVERVAFEGTRQVEGGDLVLVVSPA